MYEQSSDDFTPPRHEKHGDAMQDGMSLEPGPADSPDRIANIQAIHCHECWRYTDDAHERGQVLVQAVNVLVNSNTLAVENSEAFKSADALLKATFDGALAKARHSGLPRF